MGDAANDALLVRVQRTILVASVRQGFERLSAVLAPEVRVGGMRERKRERLVPHDDAVNLANGGPFHGRVVV
jgi:hypothetical protein